MPIKAKKIKLPPDPDGMNDLRALWAEDTIAYFGKEHGEPDEIETNIVDLIGDIAHYCDREELQLGRILRIARFHYDGETSGKGKQEFSAEEIA